MKKFIVLVLVIAVLVCLWVDLSKKTFVLYYHNVGSYKSGLKSMYISKENFSKQVKYLKWRGYKAIRIEELIDIIKKGMPIPKKTYAITFDDGYKNIYENAYPVLEEFGYPAAVFIATDEIGKTLAHERTRTEKRLSSGEIKKMSSKWDFESHGITHRYLDALQKEEIKRELALSAKLIERITNKKPRVICYPGGKYDNEVKYFSEQTGYKGACTTKPGLIGEDVDLYELPRIEWKEISASSVQNIWELKEFFVKILLGA